MQSVFSTMLFLKRTRGVSYFQVEHARPCTTVYEEIRRFTWFSITIVYIRFVYGDKRSVYGRLRAYIDSIIVDLG
jgi:hypothetical protein